MPSMPAPDGAVEHGGVLRLDELAGGAVEVGEVDVVGAAVAVEQLRARHAERDLELDHRLDPAAHRGDAVERHVGRVDAAERDRRELPPVRAGEVDEPARGHAGRQAVARLLVDQLPAALADRRVRAQEMAHRRPPIPSEPSMSRGPLSGPGSSIAAFSSAPSAFSVMSPSWNRIPFAIVGPLRAPAEQELEVHREVLVLLVARVGDDRARVLVLLDGEALLVPADGLGLLRQRGEDARQRPDLLAELLGRLVVLVESHGANLPLPGVLG